MLAATDLLVFAFQVPFAVRRPALHSSACRRTQVPHASISLATTMSVAEDLAGLESAVVTDTLLDIAVYLLLAGVAGLTLYSLVVTLQKSNEEYGGWTPKDDRPSPVATWQTAVDSRRVRSTTPRPISGRTRLQMRQPRVWVVHQLKAPPLAAPTMAQIDMIGAWQRSARRRRSGTSEEADRW